MTHSRTSPADPKPRRLALDGRGSSDSPVRSVLTDVAVDLYPLGGEAALVFAHLRDQLAELMAAAAREE